MKINNMASKLSLPILIYFVFLSYFAQASIPIVMNTWRYVQAADKAWSLMKESHINALDAVTAGCTTCEDYQCGTAVGYGGSPDENGETTLDSMIFDGDTMDMGGVGGLRRIKNAAKVARHVLENTKHSLIAGDLATEFAKNFGFKEESLSTNYSTGLWNDWKAQKCQPNFWKNVEPDPTKSCAPYQIEDTSNEIWSKEWGIHSDNHDTIGFIAVDKNGSVAAGTSTNGLNHKIAGRVGDSPLPGAGAYADSEFGAAVSTGDGDVMMRFLSSFLAVEELRRGASATNAAKAAVARIAKKYPDFFGAVLVSTNKGDYGAACNGMDTFPFCVANEELGGVVIEYVNCTNVPSKLIN